MLNKIMQINFKKQNKGFTIIEVLVALAIFSLSVVIVMVTLSSGISNINTVSKKITATYLAQEGLEAVRNVRDDYMLFPANGAGWSDFLTNVYQRCNTNGCGVNDLIGIPFSSKIETCGNISCHIFEHSIANGGGYGVDLGGDTSTVFNRVITATTNGADEVIVKSSVSWLEGGVPHIVSFTEELFNWYTIQPAV